jgi:hypothetical protein
MEYSYNSSAKKSGDTEQKPEKKVEKVISGKAKARKKGEIRKFADIFLPEDAASVKDYVVMDVIIPAAKNLLSDIIVKGSNLFLFGETGSSNKRGGGVVAGHVSYGNYYNNNNNNRNNYSARATYAYDDIICNTRADAEAVLNSLVDLVQEYGTASVADLYEMVGVTGDYTAHKYGWTDLRSATYERTRDGYLLRLPKAIALK